MALLAPTRGRRWTQVPPPIGMPIVIRPYWLDRGLKALYLQRGFYSNNNYVTMTDGTTAFAGAGEEHQAEHVEPNLASIQVNWESRYPGFDIVAAGQCSFVVLSSRTAVDDSAVDYSILSIDTGSTWNGFYGGLTGGAVFANCVSNNDFGNAGSIGGIAAANAANFIYDGYYCIACSWISGSRFVGSINGGLYTSTLTPALTLGTIVNMTIGGIRIDGGANLFNTQPGAKHRLFACSNVAWTDGELQAISRAPINELFVQPVRRSYFFFDSNALKVNIQEPVIGSSLF